MSDTKKDVEKRILLLTFMLGVMAGVGAYLLYKASQGQNVALVAVVLPMALTSIPLIKSLRELVQLRRRSG